MIEEYMIDSILYSSDIKLHSCNVTLFFCYLLLLSCNPVSLFCHLVSLFCYLVLHWHDVKLHFSNMVEHSCMVNFKESKRHLKAKAVPPGDSPLHYISFRMTHHIAQICNPFYTKLYKKTTGFRWFIY
jgi:hypothetical protein